jgi:hypothetical protein
MIRREKTRQDKTRHYSESWLVIPCFSLSCLPLLLSFILPHRVVLVCRAISWLGLACPASPSVVMSVLSCCVIPILSYFNSVYFIFSSHISSHFISSSLPSSSLLVSSRLLSRLVRSGQVFLSYLVLSYLILSYLILSYPIASHHIVSYLTLSHLT